MKVAMAAVFSVVLLQGCSKEYELKKFYKDPNSPAAVLMGSTYAGVLETFNSMGACEEMKREVEADDEAIGYTNSRFVCDEK